MRFSSFPLGRGRTPNNIQHDAHIPTSFDNIQYVDLNKRLINLLWYWGLTGIWMKCPILDKEVSDE